MKKSILLCCLICALYGCKKELQTYPKTTLPGTTWKSEFEFNFLFIHSRQFIKFNSDTSATITVADVGDFDGSHGIATTYPCVIHIDNQKNRDTFEINDPTRGIRKGATTADANQIIFDGETFDKFN